MNVTTTPPPNDTETPPNQAESHTEKTPIDSSSIVATEFDIGLYKKATAFMDKEQKRRAKYYRNRKVKQ